MGVVDEIFWCLMAAGRATCGGLKMGCFRLVWGVFRAENH
jgi:hypothetical protein